MIKIEFHNPFRTRWFGSGVKVSSGKVLSIFSRKEFDTEPIKALTELVMEKGTKQEDGSTRYTLKDIMTFEKSDCTISTKWVWIDAKGLLHVGDRLAIDAYSDEDLKAVHDAILRESRQ